MNEYILVSGGLVVDVARLETGLEALAHWRAWRARDTNARVFIMLGSEAELTEDVIGMALPRKEGE